MSLELFKKTYSGESLHDLDRDVSESLQEVFNPLVAQVPSDIYGFQTGIFTVTITWKDEP